MDAFETRRGRAAIPAAIAVAGVVAMTAAPAQGHIERAGYWPDPAADTSIRPAAGGKVPKVRSLASALRRKPAGRTRVVCKPRRASLRRLRRSIRRAVRVGYKDRPSQRRRRMSRKQARRLLRMNLRLRRRCRFRSIQAAVNASRNNDRIVVMPGVYAERRSRRAPNNDPRCAGLKETNDEGETGAVSYAYQFRCPNDQNLIAVLGRALGPGEVPQPPLDDRRGIPAEGRCIRCNLQIEGSGVNADDVVVDAGRVKSRNGGPANPVKDVVIRADRADGFVLRKLTLRHAREHGIYVVETDGYRLARFKTFYNEEYGVLTFVPDHGLMRFCEAAGSGDSGLYPGAAPETGEQVQPPDGFRYNQRISRCDSHHNVSGYSGTDGNAIRVDHNNFYDNALGFTTDVFTAAGHPGFPQDSDLVERNRFYSNNFNPYRPGSNVVPTVEVPVGTGMWIAGGNNNVVRNNFFYDNWRRGAMLFGVPDSFISGCDMIPGCDQNEISTSFRNRFYDNVMGRTPSAARRPNGTDFWWDDVIGQVNNCWFGNTGKDGTGASVTFSPADIPTHASNCATADGHQAFAAGPQQLELLACIAGEPSCTWAETPPRPGG